jgi:hypothetical protein
MSANVQHQSATNEAYTPPEVVEAARATMGGIHLDPFSCKIANKIVQADLFYSEGALTRPWGSESDPTNVFCNPPGGTLVRDTLEPSIRPDGKPGPGYSSAAVAWAYLLNEYLTGNVAQAIFVCFSLNTFQNSQKIPGCRFAPYMFPFCVPSNRLRFWCKERPIGKGQPSQPNALIYIGENIETFAEHFAPIGQVRT